MVAIGLPSFATAEPPSCGVTAIITEDSTVEEGAFVRAVKVCELVAETGPSCNTVATFSSQELRRFRQTIYAERFKNGGILVGTVVLTLFSPVKPQMLAVLRMPYGWAQAAMNGRGTTSVAVEALKTFAPAASHKWVGIGAASTFTGAAVSGNQNPLFRFGRWIYEGVWYPNSKEAASAILEDRKNSVTHASICARDLEAILTDYFSKMKAAERPLSPEEAQIAEPFSIPLMP